MFDSYESSIGERIRYYRKRSNMTQKALAEACGITEPAIRNYELGNRIPSFDTLDDISNALHINYYALAEPNLATYAGVMQCFFRLEYAHGLKPVELDGQAALIIDPKQYGTGNPLLQKLLNTWLDARKKYESGEWSEEMYEDWECTHPLSNLKNEDTISNSGISAAADTPIKPKQKRGRKPKKKD